MVKGLIPTQAICLRVGLNDTFEYLSSQNILCDLVYSVLSKQTGLCELSMSQQISYKHDHGLAFVLLGSS